MGDFPRLSSGSSRASRRRTSLTSSDAAVSGGEVAELPGLHPARYVVRVGVGPALLKSPSEPLPLFWLSSRHQTSSPEADPRTCPGAPNQGIGANSLLRSAADHPTAARVCQEPVARSSPSIAGVPNRVSDRTPGGRRGADGTIPAGPPSLVCEAAAEPFRGTHARSRADQVVQPGRRLAGPADRHRMVDPPLAAGTLPSTPPETLVEMARASLQARCRWASAQVAVSVQPCSSHGALISVPGSAFLDQG